MRRLFFKGFLQAWQPEQRALIQQYIDAQSVTITAYSDMQYAVWADERFIGSKAALLSDDPHVFSAEAKKSKPRQMKATFRVCDSDGKPAKSCTQHQHIFKDRFSKLLHGGGKTLKQLIEQEREHHAAFRFDEGFQVDLCFVATYGDVAKDAQAAKRFKATAEDQMAGDLAKAAPREIAAIRHPIHVKSSLGLRPPLQ